MNIKKTLPAVAGFFIASAALAVEQFLSTPTLSAYVDAESSVNVPLPTTEGRHIKLTLAFDSSPSNAVQVAFGRDLNGSETLESEETDLIVGCDCGEIQMKVEGEGEQRNVQVSFEEQESDLHCSPSPSIYTYPTPLSLAPNVSSCTYGLTPSNSFLIAWQNAFVNRSATNRIDASIELFSSGAITITTLRPGEAPSTNYQAPTPPPRLLRFRPRRRLGTCGVPRRLRRNHQQGLRSVAYGGQGRHQ